jgi:hypothetical protein
MVCSGYGLLEDEVGMELSDPDQIDGGVKVLYLGDMRKWTQVSYVCDRALNASDLKLPTSVDIEGYELQFVIGSRMACADPFLTATPLVTLTLSPGPTPTPSPREVKAVSGGSVFLAIVLIPVVLYVVVGVFVTFLRTGIPSIANEAFWASCYDAIAIAVTWIGAYGRAAKPDSARSGEF